MLMPRFNPRREKIHPNITQSMMEKYLFLMFLTNSPFSENNPDSAFDVYVFHPSNNSLSSKTIQKISKYNQSNEIANVNTIFIPVGFDLYGKLRAETTKLIDDIALFGYIWDSKQYHIINI
jgi:hypothetical protein